MLNSIEATTDIEKQLDFQVTHNKQLMEELLSLKKELGSARDEYYQLFNTTRDAIALLDSNLNVITVNKTLARLFSGFTCSTVKPGLNLDTILDNFPASKEKILHAIQQAAEGICTPLIVENPIKNAKVYYCYEISIHSHQYDNKQEFLFKIRNVTKYKLKERMQHKQQSDIALSSRVTAMGEMVSALAHEINQPLAAINAYSRSCLHILNNQPNNDLVVPLEKIAAQTELVGEIIHNMKEFMRAGNLYLEETDINQLIYDTLNVLQYELLDPKFKIKLDLMNNPPKLMSNKIHIMQVILNLARNSIEAIDSIEESSPEISIQTNLLDDFIQVHIKDNGPGIPKEFKSLILNTYFTTKHKGTGVGLGICRTLIEEHGGTLSFQQQEGRGAWFTFALPINI